MIILYDISILFLTEWYSQFYCWYHFCWFQRLQQPTWSIYILLPFCSLWDSYFSDFCSKIPSVQWLLSASCSQCAILRVFLLPCSQLIIFLDLTLQLTKKPFKPNPLLLLQHWLKCPLLTPIQTPLPGSLIVFYCYYCCDFLVLLPPAAAVVLVPAEWPPSWLFSSWVFIYLAYIRLGRVSTIYIYIYSMHQSNKRIVNFELSLNLWFSCDCCSWRPLLVQVSHFRWLLLYCEGNMNLK